MSEERICIVGAGAVGGTLGARLAAKGYETSALARGRTLEALRQHGWRHREADGTLVTAPVHAEADPAMLGTPDLVVLAVKGPSLPGLAASLATLVGPKTMVLTAMNGVPWWFFDGIGGPYEGLRLAVMDPDGDVAAAVPSEQIVGCVVHFSATAPEPGWTELRAGSELIVGAPHGGVPASVADVAVMLGAAGFTVRVSERIQSDVWFKLWGNMTMNPISALTGATTDRILDDDLVKAFVDAVMTEAAEVGARIGCSIAESPADRNAATRRLGAMRTSMLADVEAGRPLELDALLTAVAEIARRVAVPTSNLDVLLGLTRLAARTRGLYPPSQPVTAG